MRKSVPISEQETTITYSRDSKTAHVYSCDTTVMTRLDKLCKTRPNKFRHEKEDEVSKWYIVDKGSVRFYGGMQLTEEQKAKKAEIARNRFSKINSKP